MPEEGRGVREEAGGCTPLMRHVVHALGGRRGLHQTEYGLRCGNWGATCGAELGILRAG